MEKSDSKIFRTKLLEESLAALGGRRMNQMMRLFWERRILPAASEIAFQRVRAQFDPFGEIFFITFHFRDERCVTATVYPDSETEEAVFSVSSGGETFMQSALPVDEFFKRLKNLNL
jgi:hypothetical protein